MSITFFFKYCSWYDFISKIFLSNLIQIYSHLCQCTSNSLLDFINSAWKNFIFSDRVHTFLGHHVILVNKLKPGLSVRSRSTCVVLYLLHRCVPWLITDQKFSCFCRLNGKILATLRSCVNIVNPKQEPDIVRVAAIGTLCGINKREKKNCFYFIQLTSQYII